jgi:superfamily II DNA or RNA helicase
MYGMSANIGDRFDGADHQLHSLFGEVIYSMTYQEAQSLGLVAPIRVEWVNIDFRDEELSSLTNHKLEKFGIWNNDIRNRLFAEKMHTFGADIQCLTMVPKVEHAVRLKKYLPDYILCYDKCENYAEYVNQGLINPEIDPPMTSKRRDWMRQQFERGELLKVIATDVWSTGVDFVSLPVLGRADGRDSRIMDTQIPCRANLVFAGKNYATLVDCNDLFHPTLSRRSKGRKKFYENNGWLQSNWVRGSQG